MAHRRQPVTRRWEQRRGLHEGFHSETPRRPLGAETRGARVGGSAWVQEMCCREGQRSTERRDGAHGAAPWCVLLPASQILQDSVNLFFFAESLKERQQVQELCVIHIVKPGLDWDLGRRENHLQLAFIWYRQDYNRTQTFLCRFMMLGKVLMIYIKVAKSGSQGLLGGQEKVLQKYIIIYEWFGNSQHFQGGKCKRRVNCQQWWRCWALVPADWGL